MRPRVWLEGAFDIFHAGHLNFIQKAREIADSLGGELWVGVHSDTHFKKYRGYLPALSYKNRAAVVGAIRGVDRVVKNSHYHAIPEMRRYHITHYVSSSQWADEKQEEQAFVESAGGKMFTVQYTDSLSSTDVSRKLLRNCLACLLL